MNQIYSSDYRKTMPTPMKPIEYPKMPPFPDYVPVILIP